MRASRLIPLSAFVLAGILSGCGGGSTCTTCADTTTQLSGTFVDDPVSGLSYVCDASNVTNTGTTDASGKFNYYSGQTCTFKVGNVTLGLPLTVPSDGVVTPQDVAKVNRGVTNSPAAVAIAQFLQSFNDGSAAGKIVIPAAVRTSMAGATATTLVSSSGVVSQEVLNTLVGVAGKALVTETAATNQLQAQITAGTVVATTGSVSATTRNLIGIKVSSAASSNPLGLTEQFTVTGYYSNGDTEDLTSSATFTSSDTGKVTVSSAGLGTGVGVGTSTITASYTPSGKTTALTASLTQTTAEKTLLSIAVTSAAASNTVGATEQFTATGTYSDGSQENLTSSATWTSSDTTKVTVTSAGVGTGVAAGTSTITASYTPTGGSAVSGTVVQTTLGTLGGSLSGVGGTVAFNENRFFNRMLAFLFGKNAMAGLGGVTAIAGATVELIEINSAGNKVGAVIATATTNSAGEFTLATPVDFVASPKYKIQTSSGGIDRLVTGTTAQAVDPVSSATTAAVVSTLGTNSVENLLPNQVQELISASAQLAASLPTASDSASLKSAVKAASLSDEESYHSLTNAGSATGIQGHVKDGAGNPLSGVMIVVRDYGEWVTRATTKTKDDGSFKVNVAPGNYIIGAKSNKSSNGKHWASEWWTCNYTQIAGETCGTSSQYAGTMVTVPTSGRVEKYFALNEGVKFNGTIKSTDGSTALPGVKFFVRLYGDNSPTISSRADENGEFSLNFLPGDYFVEARNDIESIPYGTIKYDGPTAGGSTQGGVTVPGSATKISVVAGNSRTFNFKLPAGGLLKGKVTNGVNGPAMAGSTLRINAYPQPEGAINKKIDSDGNSTDPGVIAIADLSDIYADSTRTDMNGEYVYWMPADTAGVTYLVFMNGQKANADGDGRVLLTTAHTATSPYTQNFTAQTSFIKGKLIDIAGRALTKVNVALRDATTYSFVAQNNSSSDGSFQVAAPAGTYIIEFKVQTGEKSVGSAIYEGNATPSGIKSRKQGFNQVLAAGTDADLGTVKLPAGGELAGYVYNYDGTPAKNASVWVNYNNDNGYATTTSSDGSYSISVVPALLKSGVTSPSGLELTDPVTDELVAGILPRVIVKYYGKGHSCNNYTTLSGTNYTFDYKAYDAVSKNTGDLNAFSSTKNNTTYSNLPTKNCIDFGNGWISNSYPKQTKPTDTTQSKGPYKNQLSVTVDNVPFYIGRTNTAGSSVVQNPSNTVAPDRIYFQRDTAYY